MKTTSRPRLALRRPQAGPRQESSRPQAEPPVLPEGVDHQGLLLRCAVGITVLICGIWAYWPTIADMVAAWEREPDYSHGYLVLPAALFFLWTRRRTFPEVSGPAWKTGFALVLGSVLIRLFAATYYFESIDGWSMLLWLAGVAAVLFGLPVMRWAAPSIAFLFFMIPLPFRLEGALSLPLQRVATKVSCWTLQLVGQPAIAEGNTILMGDHRLEVEQACSGLRLFVSISALAFAYLMLVQRSWWERALLLLSVIPIAVTANAMRIVATGLLYEYTSSEAAKKFSHDLAGWAMIPLAAALFGLVLWYLGKLFQEQEQHSLRHVIRHTEL